MVTSSLQFGEELDTVPWVMGDLGKRWAGEMSGNAIRPLKYGAIRTKLGAHNPAQNGPDGTDCQSNSEEEFGMTPVASHSAVKVERWRWLLYVGLAFFGALLTFVGARAQQHASDSANFRKLTDAYCAAWSSGNPDNAAKFYAKDADLVFYDVAPFSYHGWKEYRPGVQKALFDNMASGTLSAGKELKVTRRGMIAWTSVPMHLSMKSKDGKSTEADLRYTGIWEKRGPSWVLVHEHISAPMQ